MNINNPQIFDHIKEGGGDVMRCRRYDLGAWDMDNVAYVDVTHGITMINIVTCSALIFQNGASQAYTEQGPNPGVAGALVYEIYATTVRVKRDANASGFDQVAFNDAVMNRGYLFIWYKS